MKTYLKYVVPTLVSIFISSFSGFSFASSNLIESNGIKLYSDYNVTASGKININGNTSKNLLKLLVIKDGQSFWYNLDTANGSFNKDLSLTNGTGSYDVYIMSNEYSNMYSYGPKITVQNVMEVNKNLVPTKDVDSDNLDIASLSKQLTEGLTTDRQKIKSIYDWVSNNIKYDTKKLRRQMQGDYSDVYGAENTFITRKGVCYDYSTLLAALARASGLEVKVVKGDFITPTGNAFHAWNEAYLREEGKWISMDSTFGYVYIKNYFDIPNFNEDHRKTGEY